jgi:hypothetical protein
VSEKKPLYESPGERGKRGFEDLELIHAISFHSATLCVELNKRFTDLCLVCAVNARVFGTMGING